MKQPEQTDLIYLDIQKDIANVKKTIVIRNDEIKAVKSELDALPPRSPEEPAKTERIRVLSDDARRLAQLQQYYEIKLKKRAVLAKMKYEIAYSEKKEWPSQREFDRYLIAKGFDNSPIHTINKSDNSRSSTHQKDVQQILDNAEAKEKAEGK